MNACLPFSGRLCRSSLPRAGAAAFPADSDRHCNGFPAEAEVGPRPVPWRPLVLLIPLRLGLTDINAAYTETLKVGLRGPLSLPIPPHPDCPANSWPQPGQVWLPLRGPLCSHQRALPCHHLVGPSAPPAALGVLLASRLRIRSALCRYLFVPHSGFLVLACTSCQDPVFTPPPPPAPVVPSVPEPAGCPTSPAAHASLRSTVS